MVTTRKCVHITLIISWVKIKKSIFYANIFIPLSYFLLSLNY